MEQILELGGLKNYSCTKPEEHRGWRSHCVRLQPRRRDGTAAAGINCQSRSSSTMMIPTGELSQAVISINGLRGIDNSRQDRREKKLVDDGGNQLGTRVN